MSKTKFSERNVELVTDEKWHQRWYRDPSSNRDSETDILLMFADASDGNRYALHIENKPNHRKWEPDQPENYRKRAENRKSAWRYVDYQIVLLAPVLFIARYPVEAAQFDLLISYEDVAAFIPEFAGAGAGVAGVVPA